MNRAYHSNKIKYLILQRNNMLKGGAKDYTHTLDNLEDLESYPNFKDMHYQNKFSGSYRRGMIVNPESGEIERLMINFHKTSPDSFNPDLSVLHYAGRGKKNTRTYERIVDQVTDKKYHAENMKIIKSDYEFPVFARFWFDQGKKVYLLGNYKYSSHVIKKGDNNIRYYYIRLERQ